MSAAIFSIIYGLIFILYPKTNSYKKYVRKHNFEDRDEFLSFFRNVVGVLLIILGVLLILQRIFS